MGSVWINLILATIGGAAADRGDFSTAISMVKAHYYFWSVMCFIFLIVMQVFGTQLVRILKFNMKLMRRNELAMETVKHSIDVVNDLHHAQSWTLGSHIRTDLGYLRNLVYFNNKVASRHSESHSGNNATSNQNRRTPRPNTTNNNQNNENGTSSTQHLTSITGLSNHNNNQIGSINGGLKSSTSISKSGQKNNNNFTSSFIVPPHQFSSFHGSTFGDDFANDEFTTGVPVEFIPVAMAPTKSQNGGKNASQGGGSVYPPTFNVGK
ncbi:hypothetical protein HDU76_006791 [Blyttiomyces sp. JEL0837]|nr:hypothetical protein HDU76_006791 [Blyttiomyces sp. JEL0837]